MGKPIIIPDLDKELLKECKIDTFRSSGKGGQHVNKTDSAVRLTHIPTNIVITCQDERSQYKNKQTCIMRLREKINTLNYKPPTRIITKKPMGAKKRILDSKKKHSIKKQMRKKPEIDD